MCALFAAPGGDASSPQKGATCQTRPAAQRAASCAALAALLASAHSPPALADDMPPEAAAGPAASFASAPAAMTTPSMSGPLAANPHPLGYNFGLAGTVHVPGALTGLGLR